MTKIYLDFDGVLVDTPRLIKKEISLKGNNVETLKNFSWSNCLKRCCEIENNIKYIKKISKKHKFVNLTHVYSEQEIVEKCKYILEKIGQKEVVTVPYYLKKSDVVKAKNNILIDDYILNIENWKKEGGIGILFKKERKIKNILNKYFQINSLEVSD